MSEPTTSTEDINDHSQHGLTEDGDRTSKMPPRDPDCVCRGTSRQAACADAGCGFCHAARTLEKPRV